MTPRRQRLPALAALVLFAAGCGLWLARLDYSRKVSTDVLDLVPRDQRSPELALVRNLAQDVQARVMLFVLSDPARPGAPPADAARQFARSLAADPAFAEAAVLGGGAGEAALGRALFARRFSLLLPTWLGEHRRAFERTGLPPDRFSPWLAERAAAELEGFLARPEAAPLEDLAVADPLLLVPNLVERAEDAGMPGANPGGAGLVWARIRASPLSAAGQGPVFAAVDRAFARVRAAHPGLELRWTGVNRFAAASRARIESEIRTLNLLSLLAVLCAGCLFVRRLWQLLHLAPVVLCSMLGAWTVSTLVFSRLHVLVFAIGSLLSGVAIDYGFYIFVQPYLRPDETYSSKLRRLIGPLLASCLTTVAGFSLLLFSDLPLIREVGLFVSAGLLTALGAAAAYFAQLDRPCLETRRFARSALPPAGRRARRIWQAAAVLAAAVAAAGPWRLHWRDDIRELDVPQVALRANDRAVRARFGDEESRAVYLTYGATPAQARSRLADFLGYEAATRPGAGAASLGFILPTEADYRAMPRLLGELGGFSADFRAALAKHGFLPDSFGAFFAEWNALRRHPPDRPYDALYAAAGRILSGPLRLLYSVGPSQSWFLTLVDGPERPVPAALHTVGVNRLESLNALFTHYRWSALRLSLVGLALIIASVFVIYPVRRAVRIALIPAGSCFFVFGVLGLAGCTLNLFHLLGAFLAFCLAHNYSILSSESAWGRTAPPASIRLSALCASGSFGVLALSDIPVVHALGMTVALIVLTALCAVELEPLVRAPR